MDKIKKYSELILEDGEGGGTAFSTLNGNGMGNVVTPQVGTQTGSVWQNGCGSIGSGDVAAYSVSTPKFVTKKGKNKKGKKGKLKNVVKYIDFFLKN